MNKRSNIVPDVAAVLERAFTDESMQQPLTAAAYLVSESTGKASLDGTIET